MNLIIYFMAIISAGILFLWLASSAMKEKEKNDKIYKDEIQKRNENEKIKKIN